MSVQVISSTVGKTVLQIEIDWSASMLNSELKLQKALNDAGSKATELLLSRFDTNGKPIQFGSVSMTSKGKVDCAYQTPYGEVVVPRHVYQTSKGGKTFCPLDKEARIIQSATPFFAKQVSSKYAEFSSRAVVRDLLDNHGRKVDHTYVQSIVDSVAAVAQVAEEDWEYKTPKQDEAVTSIAIGVDGTCMLTVSDGWRQAMVGTIALYSRSGQRLHTIYVGATPQYGKETFIERMEREIQHVKKMYSSAFYVGIADGARDNWPFLIQHTDRQVLDFFHASEYLTKVADAVFFKSKNKRDEWLDDACHRLKHDLTGPAALLKEMQSFLTQKMREDRHEIVKQAVTYFKNNKNLMLYAQNIDENLPIGSGVTEAACKLIVKQRLCCSGMRWKEQGAAAVLSLRALSYTTGRWQQFWQKIDIGGYPIVA